MSRSWLPNSSSSVGLGSPVSPSSRRFQQENQRSPHKDMDSMRGLYSEANRSPKTKQSASPLLGITSSHLKQSSIPQVLKLSKYLLPSSVKIKNDEVSTTEVVTGLGIPGVTQGVQDVHGMSGRIRLQRDDSFEKGFASAGQVWMDQQRQNLQAYEYLCRIGEAKRWIENIIKEAIPSELDLEEVLRDGVILAKLARVFAPDLVPRIFEARRLQFRHSDNYVRFAKFLQRIELPEIFRFELIDLYEKRNIPRVIFCVHALSFLLSNKGLATPMGDLLGKLTFSEDELRHTQKNLDALGSNMPNFNALGQTFDGIKEQETAVQTQKELEAAKLERAIMAVGPSVTCLHAEIKGFHFRAKLAKQFEAFNNYETKIVQLQAQTRGFVTRLLFKQRLAEYHDTIKWLIQIQIASRGAFARMHYRRVQSNHSKFVADGFQTILQAACRGYFTRKHASRERRKLLTFHNSILQVQSLAKGYSMRQHNEISALHLDHMNESISFLQGLLKGHYVRSRRLEFVQTLLRESRNVHTLQSLCSGYFARRRLHLSRKSLNNSTNAITQLQSHARALLQRRVFAQDVLTLETSTRGVVALQARIRGNRQRHILHVKLAKCRSALGTWLEIQSLIRASIVRQRLKSLRAHADHTAPFVIMLQALIRGTYSRKMHASKSTNLWSLNKLVIGIQAHCRGCLIRRKQRVLRDHYQVNVDQVIRAQSIVRAQLQSRAYQLLKMGHDPPFHVLRQFCHLLSDNNSDMKEDVEIDRLRKLTIEAVHWNEDLTRQLEQNEMKIALLVKNKITWDQSTKHSINSGLSSEDLAINLSAVNQSTRRKISLYESIFYLLQTKPKYLARLVGSFYNASHDPAQLDDLFRVIYQLFGYCKEPRERYHFVKLLANTATLEVGYLSSPVDIYSQQATWKDLAQVKIICTTQEQKHLADIFANTKKFLKKDPNLDLECDALKLLEVVIENEEAHSRKQSPRRSLLRAGRAKCLRDPAVQKMHLQVMETICETIESLVSDLIRYSHRVPFCIRFLGRSIYNGLRVQFPDFETDQIISVAGQAIWSVFLEPFLLNPVQTGLVASKVTEIEQQNMEVILKAMRYVVGIETSVETSETFRFLVNHVNAQADRIIQAFEQSKLDRLNADYELTCSS